MRLITRISYNALLFQLFRFGITGISATAVHFSIVIFSVQIIGLSPLIANVYGFFSGFIVSFSGHRYWTFLESSAAMYPALLRFLLIATINFATNQTLYYLLLIKIHLNYRLSLAIVLGIIALCTFLVSKFWVFK